MKFINTQPVIAAISAIKLIAPELLMAQPKLVLKGDGIHNDLNALQALLNGESVIAPNGREIKMEGNKIHLPSGTYNIGFNAKEVK